MFDWGDAEQSEWIGPFDSGQICMQNYSYSTRGDYPIRVKAKDSKEYESDWSEPLTVTMPKSKRIQNTLMDFLTDHPHLFPLLRLLFHL